MRKKAALGPDPRADRQRVVNARQRSARMREAQGRRHDDGTEPKKTPGADVKPFAPEHDQPQDRRQRAGHGQIRAKVDADQHRAGDLGRQLIGGDDGTDDQADRKVVHQIRRERDDKPRAPCGGGCRRATSAWSQPAQCGNDAGVIERFHQNEQAGDQRQHAPRHAIEHRPRRLTVQCQHDRGRHHAADQGRQPELHIESRAAQQHDGNRADAAEGEAPAVAERRSRRTSRAIVSAANARRSISRNAR